MYHKDVTQLFYNRITCARREPFLAHAWRFWDVQLGPDQRWIWLYRVVVARAEHCRNFLRTNAASRRQVWRQFRLTHGRSALVDLLVITTATTWAAILQVQLARRRRTYSLRRRHNRWTYLTQFLSKESQRQRVKWRETKRSGVRKI